jgi:hypothetical protein
VSELAALKRENKKLKALLKNAVELLEKSKEVLAHAAAPKVAAKKKLKSRK